MNTARIYRRLALVAVAVVCCLSVTGCDGEYLVPITSGPTRKIDQRLLGNWVSKDGTDKVKVRKLDDSVYVVSFNGDLFRAFHSDVGKTSFVSLQDLESADRKYAYMAFKLSDDGKQLDVRVVDTKVIPKELKDSASVQKLLKKNLENPSLFGDEGQFTKVK
jgi:hypothetical protein